MIRSVREVFGVVPEYFGVVGSDVVWGAVADICRAAPSRNFRVNNHLRVSGYVGQNISIARGAIIFPAASYVNQVELTLRASPLFDIQAQSYLKIRRLWQLQQYYICYIQTNSSPTIED